MARLRRGGGWRCSGSAGSPGSSTARCRSPPTPATTTDAIVVLTGGRLRLEAGLDLLDAGQGAKAVHLGGQPARRPGRAAARRRASAGARRHAASCSAMPPTTRSAMPAKPPIGCSRRAIAACAWSPAGTTCGAACWNSRGRCRRRRSFPTRFLPAASEPDASADWIDVALLTVGEYDKYLATLVRPGIAMLWPRASRAELRSPRPPACRGDEPAARAASSTSPSGSTPSFSASSGCRFC